MSHVCRISWDEPIFLILVSWDTGYFSSLLLLKCSFVVWLATQFFLLKNKAFHSFSLSIVSCTCFTWLLIMMLFISLFSFLVIYIYCGTTCVFGFCLYKVLFCLNVVVFSNVYGISVNSLNYFHSTYRVKEMNSWQLIVLFVVCGWVFMYALHLLL